MTYSQSSTVTSPSIAERFITFHAESPEVYSTLVTLARQWVRATGRRRLGVKALFERARWEIAIATSDPDFKLNNNYTAFYARLIMAQELDLADLFETRRSEADDMVWTVPSARVGS